LVKNIHNFGFPTVQKICQEFRNFDPNIQKIRKKAHTLRVTKSGQVGWLVGLIGYSSGRQNLRWDKIGYSGVKPVI